MADPIRLLILTHNYPRFRGDFAGVFIALLARKLREHQIEPIVLAPHDAGLPEKEEIDGVSIYRFRYASDDDEVIAYRGTMHQLVLGSVSGMFRFKKFLDANRAAALDIISKERIEIIAGNWLVPSGIVMKTLAAKTRLPMLLSSHGTDIRLIAKYAGMSRLYFGSLFERLDRWTVVSSFLRDEIARIEPKAAAKLRTASCPPRRDDLLSRQLDRTRRRPAGLGNPLHRPKACGLPHQSVRAGDRATPHRPTRNIWWRSAAVADRNADRSVWSA